LHVDYATGIYTGCALGIAFGFGDPRIQGQIQKSLRRLKDRGFINYPKGNGSRGPYRILINKYEPRGGELSGTRLNAWKHGELCQPEYEAGNGEGNGERNGERNGKSIGGGTYSRIQEVQEVKPSPRAKRSGGDSPEADPRHSPIRGLIQDLHFQKFGVKCEWDGSEAKALNRVLRRNPSWTGPQLSAMVRNRFDSDELPPDRPRRWLPGLGSYVAGPLDRFARLKTADDQASQAPLSPSEIARRQQAGEEWR